MYFQQPILFLYPYMNIYIPPAKTISIWIAYLLKSLIQTVRICQIRWRIKGGIWKCPLRNR